MMDEMTDEIERHDVEALLPFYVNGTLEGKDLVAVQAAINADPALTRQVDALGHIRAQMQAEGDAFSPSALGFARLSQAISEPAAANISTAPTWWRTGMIAACTAVVAVGITLQLPRLTTSEPVYEQASATQDALRLQVAFQPNVGMDAVGTLLTELELSIVSGPSALGLYELTATGATDLSKAFTALESRKDLVDYVDLLQ